MVRAPELGAHLLAHLLAWGARWGWGVLRSARQCLASALHRLSPGLCPQGSPGLGSCSGGEDLWVWWWWEQHTATTTRTAQLLEEGDPLERGLRAGGRAALNKSLGFHLREPRSDRGHSWSPLCHPQGLILEAELMSFPACPLGAGISNPMPSAAGWGE